MGFWGGGGSAATPGALGVAFWATPNGFRSGPRATPRAPGVARGHH
jgi:hypothetical protein